MVRGETHAYRRRTTEQIVGVDSCAGLVVVDAFMVEFYVQTRVQCVWSKGWPVHCVRSCGARLAGLGWYRVNAQGGRVHPPASPGSGPAGVPLEPPLWSRPNAHPSMHACFF